MTDLVHELREYAFDAGSSGNGLADVPGAICDAAASEIERLREVLANLVYSYDDDRALSNRDGWEKARAILNNETV